MSIYRRHVRGLYDRRNRGATAAVPKGQGLCYRRSQVRIRKTKDDRRERILESTWKLIARDGLGATSMRALAAEAGYANGALAYYFDGKEDLLRAAFEYVLDQTSQRVRAATRELRGLAALRVFCAEMLPDDELKQLEARVVVPFWSSALTDPTFAALHERATQTCRKYIVRCLAQAVTAGEIPGPRRARQHEQSAEMLTTILTGAQVLGVLTPEQHTPAMMWKLVDEFLAGLGER
jgi:AcrR family transcriptional regulator